VTAEPAEDFLGAVREDHDCQSQPEYEGDYAATRFEEPFKHGIPPPMAGVADRRLTRPLAGCRRPPMASGGPPPRSRVSLKSTRQVPIPVLLPVRLSRHGPSDAVIAQRRLVYDDREVRPEYGVLGREPLVGTAPAAAGLVDRLRGPPPSESAGP